MRKMSTSGMEAPNKVQTRALCEALWSWSFCTDCRSNFRCVNKICPGQRLDRLIPFFKHYKDLLCNHQTYLLAQQFTGPHTHGDLAAIFALVRSQPNSTRSTIRRQILAKQRLPQSFGIEEVDMALNLAVRAMFMINCSAGSVSPRLLEQGADHIQWRDTATLCEFVESAFQATNDSMFGTKAESTPSDVAKQVTARRLMKHLKIRFVPTSDIRCHLQYDRQANTIELYHHVALMKEHLRLTVQNDEVGVDSTIDALKTGALPRQIALEVIDSLQKLLFPLTDPKSFSLLRSLISRHSMDPDCLRFESVAIRRDEEAEVPYLYFGSRLADLYEEMQNPQPRGQLEKWLERKSGARYVMLATLAGVVIAILLGIAGLIASIFQTYFAYQAWKHPISPP